MKKIIIFRTDRLGDYIIHSRPIYEIKQKYADSYIVVVCSKINKKIRHEKLKRKDHKYDLFIPIKYNFKKPIPGLGSCIFIHLTNDYKPTRGCTALKKKDFLIMAKIIKKNSKIKIL